MSHVVGAAAALQRALVPRQYQPALPLFFPGTHAAGLEDLTLSLYGSQLERLPPELASATRLTGLRLGGNRSLAVTPQEADTLLALPGLQQLELWGTATPHQVLLGMVQHVLSSPGLSGLLLLVGQPPSSDGVEGVVRAEEEEEEEGDEDWGSDDDAEEETSA